MYLTKYRKSGLIASFLCFVVSCLLLFKWSVGQEGDFDGVFICDFLFLIDFILLPTSNTSLTIQERETHPPLTLISYSLSNSKRNPIIIRLAIWISEEISEDFYQKPHCSCLASGYVYRLWTNIHLFKFKNSIR